MFGSNRNRGFLLGLLIGCVLLRADPASAQWAYMTPDDGAVPGAGYVSNILAVVNGHPAVVYSDLTDQGLKYIRATDANGTTWCPPKTIVESGLPITLATVNGNPAVAYAIGGDFWFLRAIDPDGTCWGTPAPLPFSDPGASFAIVDGNPAFSFYDPADRRTYYTRATDPDGAAWGARVEVDSSPGTGQFTSLAMVNGRPAIAYYVAGVFDFARLRYVRANDSHGTSWPFGRDIDGGLVGVGQYASMAVVDGKPAIAYYDATYADLRFIRAIDADGGDWNGAQSIVSDGNVGTFSRLRIEQGMPAISYFNADLGRLQYIQSTDSSGSNWGTPTTTPTVGSFEIVNGNPAISFYDANAGTLSYVRASDSGGSAWEDASVVVPTPGLANVGWATSLAVVTGKPAIAYWALESLSPEVSSLKYVRATNNTGTEWGTPVFIETAVAAYPGSHTSLEVVNGNPAVLYDYAEPIYEWEIIYARAADSDGTSWTLPIEIDEGYAGDLKVINGNPAITYLSEGTGITYLRAIDSEGVLWSTPITIETTSSVINFSAPLAVVNGNPAILYRSYNDSSGQVTIRFIRAEDPDGSVWGEPVAIDDSGYAAGDYSALTIVDGQPAAAYDYVVEVGRFIYRTGLRYVRAADANGTAWGTPQSIYTQVYSIGRYIDLEMAYGTPTLTCTGSSVHIMRSVDFEGTAWDGPITVDPVPTYVGYPSLAVVNGNAAVSYQADGKLKYAYYGVELTPTPTPTPDPSGCICHTPSPTVSPTPSISPTASMTRTPRPNAAQEWEVYN